MFILRLGLSILLSLLSLFACLAQSDFQSGYVVTPAKDTLQGLIDNRSETRNGRIIHFKSSLRAEAIKYEPTQILAYGFADGKMYQSKRIQTDSSSTVLAFLELLVKGKINLYHYKDDTRFYVEKAGTSLTPLYQTETKVMKDGKHYIKARKEYIATFNILMADCPDIRKSIDKTQLEYKHLITLVTVYNQCGAEGLSFQTNRKFLLIKRGILAGGQYTTINFTSNSPDHVYLTSTNFKADIQPFFGMFINTTFPWITQKVSLQAEAQISKTAYYSDSERTMSNKIAVMYNETTIDLIYLRLPLALRYTYPRGKVKPYFQAGAMFDFVLNKKVHILNEERWPQTVHTTEYSVLNTRKVHTYGTIGGGIEYKLSPKLLFFAEIRGSIGVSLISPAVSNIYKAQTRILALQTGIAF